MSVGIAIEHLPAAQAATLRELAEAVGDDFVREIFDDLCRDGAARVEQMSAAVAGADAEAVARGAHTLGSMALSLGFDALGGVCRRMELHALQGRLDEAATLLPELHAGFAAVAPVRDAL